MNSSIISPFGVRKHSKNRYKINLNPMNGVRSRPQHPKGSVHSRLNFVPIPLNLSCGTPFVKTRKCQRSIAGRRAMPLGEKARWAVSKSPAQCFLP